MKVILRNTMAGAMHLSGLAALSRRRRRDAVTISCYHRVLPDAKRRRYAYPDLAVTPEVFADHVAFCRQHYDCLTLSEAMGRTDIHARPSRPMLCITFDDGYWDNSAFARTILNDYGLHATFFVVSGLVGTGKSPWYDRLAAAVGHLQRRTEADALADHSGEPAAAFLADRLGGQRASDAADVVRDAKRLPPDVRDSVVERACTAAAAAGWRDDGRDRLMTAEQLRELAEEGHEVASHTRTHQILTQLGRDRLAHELSASRLELEGMLNQPVVSLAYPNGDHDDAVVAAARDAGYRYAVTTLPGVNEAGVDPLRMRRIHISQERTSRLGGACSTHLLELELAGVADALFRRRRPTE